VSVVNTVDFPGCPVQGWVTIMLRIDMLFANILVIILIY